ncbi:MAG: galactonate dehydratase [Chloroflexi bacterium]|nr:galactonate dehydratase [Chloroflexota bacterium]
MKITSVEAIPSSAKTAFGSRNYVYVKIGTDEGITGWGEATCGPLAVANMVEEFGETLVGKDPGRIEEHWQRLYHHFHVRGGVIQMSAISGIEIALWDIKGKALGVPVYELLGGRMRDKIWTYGRWDGATPELAVERAMGFVEQGLTALKGDPFDHTGIFMARDVERHAIAKIKAVREAVGDDVELLLEVHGRLSPAAAIHMGNAVEEYRPFVYEEPVPPQNIDALQRVAEAVNIPIATGERLFTKWDYTDLLKRQIVAMIQPDVVQAGGIMELKKIAAMAEAHYVGFQPHNPYGPICTAAALQLDACTPNFMIQEGGLQPWFQDATSGTAPVQKDGFFPVTDAPGIGVVLNEEWLAANPWDPNGAAWRAGDGSMGSMQQTYWS